MKLTKISLLGLAVLVCAGTPALADADYVCCCNPTARCVNMGNNCNAPFLCEGPPSGQLCYETFAECDSQCWMLCFATLTDQEKDQTAASPELPPDTDDAEPCTDVDQVFQYVKRGIDFVLDRLF